LVNRLTVLENRKSDSAILSSYQFVLDANGNRTGLTQTEPYANVPAIGTTTYDYNLQRNRLISFTGGSFTYDDEGQLGTGYGSSYTFDYEHRLTGIGSYLEYAYDGVGRRLRATRNGTETRYIHDAGGIVLAEADANNNITRIYVYGRSLLAMATPEDRVYCYHFNATGSTIAMTDEEQSIVSKYSYDPFGGIENQQEDMLSQDTRLVDQPFKFVGQFGVMTEPNGFYYMRARYYDPQVGRFISEDPIGFDGGDVNLYAYVNNNPVMGIDPWGLEATIDINRSIYTPNSVIGTISVTSTVTNSTFSGYTLENANPPNPNLPVPQGAYSAFVRTDHSPNRVELYGVPGASNIQIHVGNSRSDVIGCFAVGTSASKDWVGGSRSAMSQIINIISTEGTRSITVNINGSTGRY